MTPIEETHYQQMLRAVAAELRALHPVTPPLLVHEDCRVCRLLLGADDLVNVRGRMELAEAGKTATLPGVTP